MDFIESQRVLYSDIEGRYEALGALYERKLWHQLTLALGEFLQDKSNHRGDNVRLLYTDFISKFEARLSQVRLAQLVSMIGQSFPDPAAAISLYTTVLANRTRLGDEASICIEMDIVLMNLRLGNTEGAKELLEAAKQKLPLLASLEAVVFSKFYKASSEYRKVSLAHVLLWYLCMLSSVDRT